MKKVIYIIVLVIVFLIGFYLLKSKEVSVESDLVTYISKSGVFSIEVPKDFTADEAYEYSLTPEKVISGVKFTIPVNLAEGTNLSSDTYISVENIPEAIDSCSAEIYLDHPTLLDFVDVGGHRFSVAKTDGAGAGNRYEETVYATPVKNGCVAVRYFIHYGVYENYPEGSIVRFDEVKLKNLFDSIRASLVLN